jgi:hypothetical protein
LKLEDRSLKIEVGRLAPTPKGLPAAGMGLLSVVEGKGIPLGEVRNFEF